MATILWLQRSVHQRDGLMLIVSFLTVSTVAAGKAVRDALLLTRRTPSEMAILDIAVVAALLVACAAQSAFLRRWPIRSVIAAMTLVFAAGDAALCMWLRDGPHGAVVASTYIWFGMQAPFVLAHASALVHRVIASDGELHASGAAAVGANLGWTLGGLAIACLGNIVGVRGLLVAAAIGVFLPTLATWSWFGDAERGAATPDTGSLPGDPVAREASANSCRATLALTFALAAIGSVATFQMKAAAGATLGSTASLVTFLGMFNAGAGAAALLLQLLFPRAVSRLGPCAAMLVTPIAMAAATLAFARTGGLTTAVVQKGIEHALRSSVHRTALDVRFLPLAADEALRARTMGEALLPRVSDAAAAIVVLLTMTLLHESASRLTVASLLFVAVALMAGMGVRREYAAALRRLVSRERVPPGASGGEEVDVCNGGLESLDRRIDLEAVGAAVVFYGSGDAVSTRRTQLDQAVARIARLLGRARPAQFPEALATCLTGSDARRRRAAVEYLSVALSGPRRRLLFPVLRHCATAAAGGNATRRVRFLPQRR